MSATDDASSSAGDAPTADATPKPRRSALATRLLIGIPLLLLVLGIFAADYAIERAGADEFGLAAPVMWGFIALVAAVVIGATIELGNLLRRLGWPVSRSLCVVLSLTLMGLAAFVALYVGHTEVQRTRAFLESHHHPTAPVYETDQPDTPGAIARDNANEIAEQPQVPAIDPAFLGLWTWQRTQRVAPSVLIPAWFAAMLLVWVVALWTGRDREPATRLQAALGMSFLVTLIGGAFACAVLLRGLAEVGFALALLSLLCARLGDAGAYFAGRLLGRHKLIPAVSPKKTIEGALGGLVASALLAWLVGSLFPAVLVLLPMPWLILAGVALGAAAQLADLLASLLKRAAEVKDSSSLVPEFGGVVDLTDSFYFALPMLIAFLAALPYAVALVS